MKKFRLLVVCGNDADATSFYRGLVPLAELEKRVPNLELMFHWGPFEFNPNRLRLVDGVFIQRPCADHHSQLVQTAKDYGLPVWVDLDDDIFNIPESNFNKHAYEANGYVSHCASSLTLADVVTVTTPALKESLRRFNDNIQVIPNAFDDRLLLSKKRAGVWPRKPIVSWRGSGTHDADLEIANGIVFHAQEHSHWKWVFFGHKPWSITRHMPEGSYAHVAWQDNILSYFNCLDKVQPSLVIVPLEDNAFNRAKSNIAWIEASFANAVTLAPNWEEWQRPGVVNYEDKRDFEEKLHRLMASSSLELDASASWEYVRNHLLLSEVNDLRAVVLKGLGA